mmetsp:Transcript_71187/g.200165  ORF Transcript_71187/g.200165 Transcript_71187/m.200165 type:complete len:167 (-) Transcript_71187:72-572(-)
MEVAEEVPDAETPDDEEPPTYPNMDLAQTVFQLEAAAPAELDGLRAQIVEVVRADKMAPYYTYLIGKYGFAADDALLAELKAANAEELAALKAALEDAEQNHGETEVLDALFGIASFHARVGDKDEAYTAFDIIVDKPKVSTGKKIDASMAKLRVALFFMVRPSMR